MYRIITKPLQDRFIHNRNRGILDLFMLNKQALLYLKRLSIKLILPYTLFQTKVDKPCMMPKIKILDFLILEK